MKLLLFLPTPNSGTVHSKVFKWSGNSFVKLQALQTYRAYDVKFFNNNGDTFLAFTNYYNGSNFNIDSFIYKWEGIKFVLFQSIPTDISIGQKASVIVFLASCKCQIIYKLANGVG